MRSVLVDLSKNPSISKKEFNNFIGKMPLGVDITSDLMDLSQLLLPDFDGYNPIKNEVEKIRVFLMENMNKFRKKPVVIKAVQWHLGDKPQPRMIEHDRPEYYSNTNPWYFIKTLEGRDNVNDGDWIITGVNGESNVVKNDIFLMTYEPVDSQP